MPHECTGCKRREERVLECGVRRRRCGSDQDFRNIRILLNMHRVIANQFGSAATLGEIEIMLTKKNICDLTDYVEGLWAVETPLAGVSAEFIESIDLAFTDLGIELNMGSRSALAAA